MITVLLEKIITILEGWIQSFTSHAQHVEDKLNSLDQTASDIETNTEPISDIADNTGAVVTPIQNIKSNTDSIKQSSQTSANNTTAILNNISTLSTNTGRAAAFAEDCANNTLDIKDKVTTIASDTTQLRADTSELNDMSDKIYEALKWSLVNIDTTETDSGFEAVVFETDRSEELEQLIISLSYTQSGTGEPSPSNPRTINPVNSVTTVFNGVSDTIAIPNPPNKVALGYIDYKNSQLVITKKLFSLGSMGWSASSTPNCFMSGLLSGVPTSGTYDVISDIYTYDSRTLTAMDMYSIKLTNGRLYTKDDRFSDGPSYKTGVTGSYCICDLETPETYSITLPTYTTIKGNNSFTATYNGNIDITYVESVKLYLDKQDN